mmetsp:Transcript_32742/g.62566  ORF Transcript_32742/g.62566 Transcript_32742/m.62566 type:complete len:224 (+) Transcript_32742:2158-2829(+)
MILNFLAWIGTISEPVIIFRRCRLFPSFLALTYHRSTTTTTTITITTAHLLHDNVRLLHPQIDIILNRNRRTSTSTSTSSSSFHHHPTKLPRHIANTSHEDQRPSSTHRHFPSPQIHIPHQPLLLSTEINSTLHDDIRHHASAHPCIAIVQIQICTNVHSPQWCRLTHRPPHTMVWVSGNVFDGTPEGIQSRSVGWTIGVLIECRYVWSLGDVGECDVGGMDS